MPKCGICGGDAPKQPCITEEGKCDLCQKEVILKKKKEKEEKKINLPKKSKQCFLKALFYNT